MPKSVCVSICPCMTVKVPYGGTLSGLRLARGAFQAGADQAHSDALSPCNKSNYDYEASGGAWWYSVPWKQSIK